MVCVEGNSRAGFEAGASRLVAEGCDPKRLENGFGAMAGAMDSDDGADDAEVVAGSKEKFTFADVVLVFDWPGAWEIGGWLNRLPDGAGAVVVGVLPMLSPALLLGNENIPLFELG